MAILSGTSQDDVLVGTASDDLFQGFTGTDTAVISSPAARSSYVLDRDGHWHIASTQGNDELSGIERVQLQDSTVAVSRGDPVLVGGGQSKNGGQASAAFADGGFVLAWQDDGDVFVQRFDAQGQPASAVMRVNTTTPGQQWSAGVAVLADQGFVVTWISQDSQDGSGAGVYSQRFDSTGAPAGPETRANTTTDNDQLYPSIAALPAGGYVITWSSLHADATEYDVYAQRYDASGAPVGGETLVNTYTDASQSQSDIAALADGGYVIIWSSEVQDGGDYGVYSQRYDANGTAVGAESRVNEASWGNEFYPAVAGLANGGFVVTWVGMNSYTPGYAVDARLFGGTGTPVTGDVALRDASALQQYIPDVAGLSGGGFAITWQEGPFTPFEAAVYTQRFDGDGEQVGDPVRVNTLALPGLPGPRITGLGDGYVVTWSGPAEPGSTQAVIFGQLFDAANQAAVLPSLSGGADADVLRVTSSTRGLDIAGNDGPDILAGASWPDRLSGGSGADRFEFAMQGNGVDEITDFDETDAIVITGASLAGPVTAGGGMSVPAHRVEVDSSGGVTTVYIGTDAEPGADIVIRLQGSFDTEHWTALGTAIAWNAEGPGIFDAGGKGSNRVEGTGGNDTLQGGNGRDTLLGQGGHDLIDGGRGIDTAVFGGSRSEYTVSRTPDGWLVVGSDGVDTLVGVERLQFDDAEMTLRHGVKLAGIPDGSAGS